MKEKISTLNKISKWNHAAFKQITAMLVAYLLTILLFVCISVIKPTNENTDLILIGVFIFFGLLVLTRIIDYVTEKKLHKLYKKDLAV